VPDDVDGGGTQPGVDLDARVAARSEQQQDAEQVVEPPCGSAEHEHVLRVVSEGGLERELEVARVLLLRVPFDLRCGRSGRKRVEVAYQEVDPRSSERPAVGGDHDVAVRERNRFGAGGEDDHATLHACTMRAVVCPDKFKGTLTSMEVAAAIAGGLRSAGWEAVEVPGADGGEGTAAVLLAARGGRWVAARASDALGRRIEGRFALLADGTAVVDAAEAIGMWRLRPDELDPRAATSRGAGELIAAALEVAETVVVAPGGTATVDGGAGALEVLDAGDGGRLRVACDVRTRWEDAARVFGPQKGADEAAVEALSSRLAQLAGGLPRDPTGMPLTGCGGGLSGALWAGLDAELTPGAALVLDELGFDRQLADADLVITGEGRLDAQTAEGKLVAEVARRARAAGVRCLAVVGRNELSLAEAAALGLEPVFEAGDADGLARIAEAI